MKHQCNHPLKWTVLCCAMQLLTRWLWRFSNYEIFTYRLQLPRQQQQLKMVYTMMNTLALSCSVVRRFMVKQCLYFEQKSVKNQQNPSYESIWEIWSWLSEFPLCFSFESKLPEAMTAEIIHFKPLGVKRVIEKVDRFCCQKDRLGTLSFWLDDVTRNEWNFDEKAHLCCGYFTKSH